jgi:hypothetical protein
LHTSPDIRSNTRAKRKTRSSIARRAAADIMTPRRDAPTRSEERLPLPVLRRDLTSRGHSAPGPSLALRRSQHRLQLPDPLK